jgi:hypothetical protein
LPCPYQRAVRLQVLDRWGMHVHVKPKAGTTS